ncbi:hypothetical protein LTR84_010593 [Exophiala bonariae]|uniref:Xylanolytic transcriptional activator regulatory domain-containing protein n=1 Tax=Exophiala bonariae TaxID=1690606 RepID=A0AAV9MTF8_9EURO|nr:hypothetical protein LTR84_010593 [Exophiala bonariae]
MASLTRLEEQSWLVDQTMFPSIISHNDTTGTLPITVSCTRRDLALGEALSVESHLGASTNYSAANMVESRADQDSWVKGDTVFQDVWAEDSLVVKTLEIVSRLREIIIGSKATSTPSLLWTPALEARCMHFFSPPKIRIFLEAYWSIWSPNWPVIHRPTFDCASIPTTLLTSLVVLGASHSPNPVDRHIARFWYDSVEQMVYTDLHNVSAALNQGHTWRPEADIQRRSVQAIQAAYAVCIYQNWDGTWSARTRIRRQRFNDVVAASRSLGFSQARHSDPGNLTRSTFDWHKFILDEEAIR